MDLPFNGKTIVITGAGSGIGRALAAGFAEDGAAVVGFGRTERALHETAERFGRGRMRSFVGDLGSPSDVDRLFEELRASGVEIDVLVNNGAVYPRETFLGANLGGLEEVLRVNVLGMARCCQRALPRMLERGSGRIINLGSFAWKRPIPEASAYSISKAAVHALTRAIAAEIDRARFPDVLVNEFVPGPVRTAMSAEGKEPAEVYPLAKSIALLASGGATGQTFEFGATEAESGGLRSRLKKLLG